LPVPLKGSLRGAGKQEDEAMETILQLVQNMAHSTPAGFAGVSGIFIFLALMVGAGGYRVRQALREEERH